MARSSNMGRFSEVPRIEIPRAKFDRSHKLHTTFDSDYLIPVLVDPIYPGDTVQLDMSFMCRLSTPLHPIMDDLYLDSFFFFVPNRLVWENWHKFLGERDPDPSSSIDKSIPVVTLNNDMSAGHGSLGDYFGLPMINYNTSNYNCNALPFRSYYLIWNEWFRDENLQSKVSHEGQSGASFLRDDGPDVQGYWNSPSELLKRGKRHDYFTSCLPWLQKGDAVELPLGTSAVVESTGVSPEFAKQGGADVGNLYGKNADDTLYMDAAVVGAGNLVFSDPTGLQVDLATATAATVNEVRQAFQVQRLLERDARAGTRMHEIIYSHFSVTPPHLAWRPEYLGGGSTPINVTPIAATATGVNHDVGDLGAAGTAYGSGHGFVKSFTEHGFLIGLVNVRIDQSYSEGFERFWHDSTRYDIYWPSLAHVGEQAVLNREIYIDDATITAGTDDGVFGYQERYAHLKYKENRITGLFRSNAAASLESWHLQEEFGAEPTLGASFITSNATEGISRAIISATEPEFIFNAHFQMFHTRAMPVYSVPGLIDHF